MFRNIDFGIFNKSYELLLLIEINDFTHKDPERQIRDKNVKEICQDAGIPLITFWANYGVNQSYIQKRISEHIPLVATQTDSASAKPDDSSAQ